MCGLHTTPVLCCCCCADFVPTTPGGLLSHAHADVLLGCLEVAMEDLVEEMTGGRAAGKLGPTAGVEGRGWVPRTVRGQLEKLGPTAGVQGRG